ncbi:hypothetical protein QJQ45_004323 [Haematococcus lacustris]|nr:hypothetical protein QJQ45_004323 [Haematococcus lacustris]
MSLLSEDEQADVLSKFVAAGFVGAKQKMVPRLSNQELQCIGIQPKLVRSALLQAFADGGPGKTILLVDSEGTEKQLEFSDKQDFNRWLQSNTLTLLLPNGTERVVAAWERLEDGGRYFTNKTFEKRSSLAQDSASERLRRLLAAAGAYLKVKRGQPQPSMAAVPREHGVPYTTLLRVIKRGGVIAKRGRPTALSAVEEEQLRDLVVRGQQQGVGVTKTALLAAVRTTQRVTERKGKVGPLKGKAPGKNWLAPGKPPQAPRSSQEASQPAASEPGPSTPLPAKRTKAEPAAEPNKAQGKAAKAKPAPQPGRWLDRDCNAALNMQRIGESKWRPLELCWWSEQGKLPAKGKEYPGLGYKRV